MLSHIADARSLVRDTKNPGGTERRFPQHERPASATEPGTANPAGRPYAEAISGIRAHGAGRSMSLVAQAGCRRLNRYRPARPLRFTSGGISA